MSFYYNKKLQMGALAASCCEEKGNKKKIQIVSSAGKTTSTTTLVDSKCQSFDFINTASTQSISNTSSSLKTKINKFQGQPFSSQIIKLKPVQVKKYIDISDFEVIGELGSGSFANVYQVKLKFKDENDKRETFALKRINRKQLENKKTQENLKLEKQILMNIKHPFLTNLKFSFADEDYIYFIMQCALGGSIQTLLSLKKFQNPRKNQRIQKFRQLGQVGIKFITGCVVLGLEELHQNNILYRDLKPQNVLIFDDGYVKLADFGLAKILKNDEKTSTQAGTVCYFAPEVVMRLGYTKLVDLWTLGVFLYQVTTSESPFRPDEILTRSTFKDKVENAEINRDWKTFSLSVELKDLINKLLRFNPEKRLGAKGYNEIKSHQFFKDFDWTGLQQKSMSSPLLPIITAYPFKISAIKSKDTIKKTYSFDYEKEKDEWNYDYKTFNTKSQGVIQ